EARDPQAAHRVHFLRVRDATRGAHRELNTLEREKRKPPGRSASGGFRSRRSLSSAGTGPVAGGGDVVTTHATRERLRPGAFRRRQLRREVDRAGALPAAARGEVQGAGVFVASVREALAQLPLGDEPQRPIELDLLTGIVAEGTGE